MSTRRINRGIARRQKLQEQAQEMAECRAARSHTQQLKVLDDRLGEGMGAVKERARLVVLIEKDNTTTRRKKRVQGKKNAD
jgi:hypothetical protein